ncbi:MAG: 50S ribosomal protein L32 [Planctomycetes bacterium]|jgi:large subunit ribosomal protein L32|nr:50S ribosomal protein L32 [Planctomycetota bacterium]
MPNPKRRHSKARKGKRRANDFLTPVSATACPNCGNPKTPHRVCENCGHYRGQNVLQKDEDAL